MKKLHTTVLLTILFAAPAFCQVDSLFVNHMVSKLKKVSAAHLNEKAYLQFDKPYYAAGDTLYFKAYVTAGEKHLLSNISGVLHVDLINPANHIDKSILVQLGKGLGWGDFALPDSLPKGNYRIRAYTQWMLNNKSNFFDQQLTISSINTGKVYESAPSQNASAQADVQFFAEGGNMVTDIRSKIAFKAIGTNGLGTDVKGIVVDNNNKLITQFASSHLGMGSFSLLPEEGKTYCVKYKMKDSVLHVANLPAPVTKGLTLSVSTANPAKVAVSIDVNHNYYKVNENKNLLVTIYNGGQLTHVLSKLDSWQLNLDLPVSKFKTGIARFTVFAPTGEPLCERLAFIENPADRINLALSTDKTAYNKRDEVQINLNTQNLLDNNEGHFSVAVVNESLLPDANNQNSILSYLLLTSELKGYIEQPNYYFDNNNDKARADLDVLMLSQGYRSFSWQQLMADIIAPFSIPAEKALSITGTVTTLNDKMPVADGTITLITDKGGAIFTRQTDAYGKFTFDNILFIDSTRFILNATDNRGGNNTLITIDKPKPEAGVSSINPLPGTDTDMTPYINNLQQQQQENLKYDPLKGKVLKQVNITTLRSSNIIGSGHADQALDVTKIKSQGTLTDVLSGRLHGIKFMGNVPFLQGFNHGPMLVIVDGAYLPQPTEDSTGNYASPLVDINPSDVETVEVLKYANASIYGIGAGNGVLIVTTKMGTGHAASTEKPAGMLSFKAPGLYPARLFYSPKYEVNTALSAKPDLRSTIYWQPELTTDETGKASFSYYNADNPGTYKVIVEGMDDAGHIGRAVYRYTVK